MKKIVIVLLTFVSSAVFTPRATFAAEIPPLYTCIAPTGTLKANYSAGIHGIPGDTNTYSGTDKVYTISDDYAMQCFCPEGGTGIQTDWVKATEFSTEEIKIYTNSGWMYIPNGSPWGLQDAPYLAKNSSYACKSSGSGGGSSSSSSSSGVGGASSSNTSGGSVLGLATTGNTPFILSVFLSGIALISSGILLRKKA